MAIANPFSAIDSSVGYLYQVRAGLLWSLQRLRHDEAFLVSIEAVDDVAFESLGDEPSVERGPAVVGGCLGEYRAQAGRVQERFHVSHVRHSVLRGARLEDEPYRTLDSIRGTMVRRIIMICQ